MRTLRYFCEALVLKALLLFFKALPVRRASATGGWLGKTIGPHLGVTRRARKNLLNALPETPDPDAVMYGMWDHLGRIIGEYPHIEALSHDIEVIGGDILQNALESEQGVIFFGAHLGNWELNAAAVLTQFGVAPDLTYRAPNNPYVDKMLMDLRSINGQISGHPKSAKGGKALMKALKKGHCAGILIDQKYNEGENVPFFGIDAMTNPAFVQLAQKYHCSLIPIRNERLEGPKFRLSIYEPIKIFDGHDTPRPLKDVIQDAHALLEHWITERPEQWLWLHRRWKD